MSAKTKKLLLMGLVLLLSVGAWYLLKDKPEPQKGLMQAKQDRLKEAEKPQQDSVIIYRQRWKDALASADVERKARLELKAQNATIKKKYEDLLNRPPLHPDTLALKLATYESMFEQ